MLINSSTRLINVLTNEYPQYTRNLYAQNPTVSFPEEMPEEMAIKFGFHVVNETPKPSGQVVTEGFPQIVDGKYVRAWNVRDFNDEEIQNILDDTRKQREFDFRSVIKQMFVDGLWVEGDAITGPGKNGKPDLTHYKETMTYGIDLINLVMIHEVAKASKDNTFVLETIDGDKEFPTPVAVDITIATMRKVYELQRYERLQVAALYKATNMNELNQVNLELHQFKY